MRVAVVTKTLSKGGAASGASNLIMALKSAGLEVSVIDSAAWRTGSARYLARQLERVVERLFVDGETHFLRLAPATISLRVVEEEFRPDVIQLCDVSGNTIDFFELAQVGCPVVHRMSDCWPYLGPKHYPTAMSPARGLQYWWFRRFIYARGHEPDALVAPSAWLADLISQSLPDKGQIPVIRNAVSAATRSVHRKHFDRVVRFGFIAHDALYPRKGLLQLRPYLEVMVRQGIRVELHIYGKTPYRKPSVGRGVCAFWHGTFPRKKLPEVLGCCDILLCPSIIDNSPNTLCEALAHGVPVIAQSGTGMDSYISGDIGALIDFWGHTQKDEEAFQAVVLSILGQYRLYSEAAYEFASRELGPRFIGSKYRQLYLDAITGTQDVTRA